MIIAFEIAILIVLSSFVISIFINNNSDFSLPITSLLKNTDDIRENPTNSEYRKTGLKNLDYDPEENQRPRVYAYSSKKDGMAPLKVNFYSHTYDIDGWIIQYRWHITGPKGFSVYTCEHSPEYIFEEPGRYTARLTILDNQWDSSVAYVHVDVYDPSKPARIEKVNNFPLVFKRGSSKIRFVNQRSQQINDIEYSITIKGGSFNRIDKEKTGTISQLNGNESEVIETPKVFFGMGRAKLTLEFIIPEHENVIKTYTLFFFGFRFIVM